MPPLGIGRRHDSTDGRVQQGRDGTRGLASENGHGGAKEDDEEESGHHRGDVYHAHARHELTDRGQDGFRDLEHKGVQGVVGIESYPGEDDPRKDGDQQDTNQDLDEKS